MTFFLLDIKIDIFDEFYLKPFNIVVRKTFLRPKNTIFRWKLLFFPVVVLHFLGGSAFLSGKKVF